MCEVRFREKWPRTKKKKNKKIQWSVKKKMDYDELRPAPNEKTQPI